MNEKLMNLGLSETDKELMENYETKLNDFQRDLLPSIFDYIVRELNNLESLINDPSFLREYEFHKFDSTIFYSKEDGFSTKIGSEIRNNTYHNVLGNISKSSPKLLFRNYEFRDYTHRKGSRAYYLLDDVKAFDRWISDIKEEYLRHIHELNNLENEISEIIFNE